MIENHPKSRIQHNEQSELSLHKIEGSTKIEKFKCDILSNFQTFCKSGPKKTFSIFYFFP